MSIRLRPAIRINPLILRKLHGFATKFMHKSGWYFGITFNETNSLWELCAMKIGRNDLCPCNSGKKYKKCCRGKETNAVGAEAAYEAGASSLAGDPEGDTYDERVLRSAKAESSPLLKRVGDYKSEFQTRRPEIEEAQEKLETYRESYERLVEDPNEVLERAETLFAESAFADVWFTVDELERTFEEVGFPPMAGRNERFIRYVAKAIDTMLDNEERSALSRLLFCNVPDYVKAGRYLDAWILQHNAIQVSEAPEGECCPFLLCIFMQALRQWQEKREREQDQLLEKVGIDVAALQNRDYEEIDGLIDEVGRRSQAAGEEIEQFLNSHPKLKAQAETDCMEAEASAIALLQRDEGRSLLLDTEEIAPWLSVLKERLTAKSEAVEALRTGAETCGEKHKQELQNLLYQISSEMADDIFTEERLGYLSTKVQEWRRSLPPDDHDAMVGLNGMLVASMTSRNPGEKHLLTMLCLLSLDRVLESVADSDFDTPDSTN